MPATLEKLRTQSTVRHVPRRNTRPSELVPPLSRDQSPEHSRARRRAVQLTARRSTAAPRRQVIDKTHVRRQRHPQPDYRPTKRKQQSKLRRFFWPFTLEKCFTLIGFVTGFVLPALFTMDLIFAWLFNQASVVFDVTFTLSGLAMLLLSWDVAKDQIRGSYRVPDHI